MSANVGKFVRQGDIVVKCVGGIREIPIAAALNAIGEPALLAEGEGSGHNHHLHGNGRFGALMFRDDAMGSKMPSGATPAMYGGSVMVDEGGTVKHELLDGTPTGDHSPIPVGEGEHVIILQREYDPRGEKLVYD